MTTEKRVDDAVRIDRRSAIKIAVGGTAGALIWAEPTIKGLAKRPAYASASSTAENYVATLLFLPPGASVEVIGDQGTVMTFTNTAGVVSITTNGGGSFFGEVVVTWTGGSESSFVGPPASVTGSWGPLDELTIDVDITCTPT